MAGEDPNVKLPILMTEAGAKKLERMLRRKFKGSGGIECFESPDGATVNVVLRAVQRRGGNETQQIFGAKITAVSAINGGIRWKYTIELGYWDMATAEDTGGTWTKTSGDDVLYAYNSAEDMNTFTSGTGTIGTGDTEVTQSDGTLADSECALLALPVGAYCQVTFRGRGDGTQLYYTIINAMNSAQPPEE
jgi:hypothetical protein